MILIDAKNKFISITYSFIRGFDENSEVVNIDNLIFFKWTFLDSFRLFLTSLQELCQMYNVKNSYLFFENNTLTI